MDQLKNQKSKISNHRSISSGSSRPFVSRLPSHILDVSESNVSMNETWIGLVWENRESGEDRKWSRGEKLSKSVGLLSSEKFTGPNNETEHQPCSSSKSGIKEPSLVNEDVWVWQENWVKTFFRGNVLLILVNWFTLPRESVL